MGLYDFNIHDKTLETVSLHEVSADKGKTWTRQWLTPTDVLQHRMKGFVTRRIETGCEFCDVNITKAPLRRTIESGAWVALMAEFDKDGRLALFAQAEDNTDRYYPKFCPECGRKL